MKIGTNEIGRHARPYILAEMSGNHNQSIERALEIVDAAAKAGAQGIKLQTYTAETMTLNIAEGEFRITDPKSLWSGRTMYDVYTEGHTPWEWHEPIMARARSHRLDCFSSPFDETAVDFLESLDAPAFKIASFECIDLPLIRKVAQTGKPIILSTGMATLAEIDDAVRTIRDAGPSEVMLLQCTSNYPASPLDSNISTIPHMRSLFECEVGLSDHTMGIGVPLAAVALGASLIEKHFTLARADGGIDAEFSLEPPELEALVTESERAWQSLGTISYGPTQNETRARSRRRSLYVAKDLKAGDRLDSVNLRRIRPGHGLPPKFYEICLGSKVTRDVSAGTPLSWDILGLEGD